MAVDARLQHEQFAAAAARLFGPMDEQSLATIEPAAQWVHVRRSQSLFRQGDPSDGVYVIVSGRMHVISERADGTRKVIGEALPGETIGEMSFFTTEARSASVAAARDSLLIKFPNDVFETVIRSHPQAVRELMRMQIARMRRTAGGNVAGRTATDVAVVAHGEVALREFTRRLVAATERIGTTLLLEPDDLERRLAVPGIARVPEEHPHDAMLVAWLNEQETRYRFVVYQADPAMSEWTERCLRMADRVLIVANAADDPRPREIERLLDHFERVGAPKRSLVLLYPNGDCVPSQTSRWLSGRELDDHYKIRWDRDADFDRLARFLAGRAVGLVLGGGGARGFAHIGVLRAMSETGLAVDAIGGTSMGASMAAQYAMGWTPRKMLEMNREVWLKIRPQSEYTVPMISVLGSKGTEKCTRMMYGETQIEDLWLRFYCVSSDLSTASTVVHTSGSLQRAVTASASVPGVAAPVVENGRLLVDGAFLDNVPADVIRRFGCGRVIASEVTVEEDQSFACSRIPSPWEMLRGKLPWRQRVPFPSMIEILLRASLLASSRRQADALSTADLVFHPPIERFGLLEFEAIDALEQCGYEHGREQIEQWKAAGLL